MNILPKKRWHVRTKQNIERVRRDEAKAAEEEKELKRRIQLAEQEARISILRKRSKISTVKDDEPHDVGDVNISKNQHINFFSEIEETGKYAGGTNKEHEAEEKALKEKFEKDIGLLTYLGQSSIEAKGGVPWYLKSNTRELIQNSDGNDEEASSKHKACIDPIRTMNKYLDIKKKNMGVVKEPEQKVKQHEKCKDIIQDANKNLTTVEILRAKRLKREADERRRSQEFLKNMRGSETTKKDEVILDDRARKYNSQFNPHLAKHFSMDRNREY